MEKKTNNNLFLQQKRALNLFLLHYFKHLAILSAFFILIFGLFYIVEPRYEKMNKIVEEDRKKKEAEIAEIKNYLSQVEKLKEDFYSIPQNEVKRINRMVPSEFSPEDLFPEIESLVKDKGTVVSIEINGDDKEVAKDSLMQQLLKKVSKVKENKSPLGKIYISLDIVGINYSNLKKLLFDLENNLRLMDVTDVNFNPEEKTVNLKITTYYLK